jgi:dUTP pyrophosphatase
LIELFEEITYYNVNKENQPYVMLGDECTYHPVMGYGWINYKINSYHVRQMALYIPALGETTLLSVKQHMSWLGTYFHAEKNTATLAFPTFHVDLNTTDEISIQIEPIQSTTTTPDFDEATALPAKGKSRQHSISLISCKVAKLIPDKSLQPKFQEKVHFTKLSPTAIIPKQATTGAAGFDVHSTQYTTILPGQIAKIGTGLSSALPQELYIRIAPRSSFALQHITVEGGVVDSDYRGEIKVLLKNNSHTPFIVNESDRIAQFIFERAAIPHIQVLPSLPPTT